MMILKAAHFGRLAMKGRRIVGRIPSLISYGIDNQMTLKAL
jgi:hypothetical protein